MQTGPQADLKQFQLVIASGSTDLYEEGKQIVTIRREPRTRWTQT